MKIDYAPLKILSVYTNTFSSIKEHLVQHHVKGAEQLTEDSLLEMLQVYGNNEITSYLLQMMVSSLHRIDSNFFSKLDYETNSMEAELKDVYMMPIIVEKWSKAKQVFKPDPDFADALLHTSKLSISASMIDHLPCHNFYVDLSDCSMFSPITGAFVYVERKDSLVYFSIYLIDSSLTYFSFYLACELDDNGCATITPEMLSTKQVSYDIWKPLCFDENHNSKEYKISRVDSNLFMIQLIAYLSIDKPQLTESDLTKNTYRKPSAVSKIRNKWSEVRIQDVGVKYGSDFRKTILKIKNDSEELSTGSKRKSPIPHFRCAHWHKFWVGKGRKTLKVMWIEPIFVGNGDSSNAIIHKMKNT